MAYFEAKHGTLILAEDWFKNLVNKSLQVAKVFQKDSKLSNNHEMCFNLEITFWSEIVVLKAKVN